MQAHVQRSLEILLDPREDVVEPLKVVVIVLIQAPRLLPRSRPAIL
jgi:hypothetical protein